MDNLHAPGEPRPGDPARSPGPRCDDAAGANRGTWGQQSESSASNRQRHGSAPRAAPSRVGGYGWRLASGLTTWKDEARRWRALRPTLAGCLCPLPDSPKLPRWREPAA